MGIKSNYQIKRHPLFETEDLPSLPAELQQDYKEIFKPILEADPYDCLGFPHGFYSHGCRKLKILENEYRLVYKIYEKPTPKRVWVISFDRHDLAYEKAKIRLADKRTTTKKKRRKR